MATEAQGYLSEIDRILVHVELRVAPVGATLSVDGRPLEKANATTLVGGTRSPGPAEAAPAGKLTVVLDPGAHVFTFSRVGFADAILNKTFAPAQTDTLNVELSMLPATLHISSDRPGSIVTVNGSDVGPVPVDVRRPPGSYRVIVKHDGFMPYDTRVAVQPGQEANLQAALVKETPSLLSRWWFWTAAGVVVAGATTATYLATRPAPERAQVSGGSLGWTLPVK